MLGDADVVYKLVVPILAKNDVEERIISKSLEFIDEVIA
jgi:hypothetical protein